MKVGLHIPQVGPFASPENIGTFARAADDAGFDSLWVFDHVVIQKEQESKYPYSPDGKMGFPPTMDFLEPLTLLTYLAGITSHTQLGTSVLVLPMRHPVLNAKILATIDHLSNGRAILGAGVGWWKQEFEVLGVPFKSAASVWTSASNSPVHCGVTVRRSTFKGEFYECVDWTCNPKPVNGQIPIWLGGESRRQLQRVGKYADGWHATAKSLPTLKDDFEVAREAAAKAGRNANELSLSVEGAGMLSSEGMEQTAAQLGRLAELGASHAILTVNPREYASSASIIEAFGAGHLKQIHAL